MVVVVVVVVEKKLTRQNLAFRKQRIVKSNRNSDGRTVACVKMLPLSDSPFVDSS